jgi:hypothetical protein
VPHQRRSSWKQPADETPRSGGGRARRFNVVVHRLTIDGPAVNVELSPVERRSQRRHWRTSCVSCAQNTAHQGEVAAQMIQHQAKPLVAEPGDDGQQSKGEGCHRCSAKSMQQCARRVYQVERQRPEEHTPHNRRGWIGATGATPASRTGGGRAGRSSSGNPVACRCCAGWGLFKSALPTPQPSDESLVGAAEVYSMRNEHRHLVKRGPDLLKAAREVTKLELANGRDQLVKSLPHVGATRLHV